MLREVRLADAQSICHIYNHYIAHTSITFEETPVEIDEMVSRIAATAPQFPWIVCEEDDNVLGYAYASTWKSRCAYRYSVESTVYVASTSTGRGIGTLLYAELIRRLKEKQYHSVIAGIALPNEASVKMHEKHGFMKVAQFREVGWKFGRWIDVGYWQLDLGGERPPGT